MNIKEVFANLSYQAIAINENTDITSICIKDSDCTPGSAFFCIKGNKTNGLNYIKNAINKGAVVIISEEYVNNCSIGQIIVKNIRESVALACDNFYKSPQKKLRKIAIVGTNGKTTVCELISFVLNKCGIPCGKIGTFGIDYADKHLNTGFTTPDTPTIYSALRDMVDSGMQAVCMELSAHAIHYNKANFKFDVTVFTNCTPEHLDFFESFDQYRETKVSAFKSKNSKLAVVNVDDITGQLISCMRGRGLITYGIENPADVFAIDYSEDENGMNFVINLFDTLHEIKNSYIGKFNLYNILATATTCALLGARTKEIAYHLCNVPIVKGRMEKVSDKIKIYVDYAHTPEGLKLALKTLSEIREAGKLICVFGCGGNRDATKREIMGEISGELADFTVITSDNPRFEEAQFIISQIERGIRRKTQNYITISDREQAIEYAVSKACEGDYILIAGKGAEEYQEQMGVFRRFSDKEIAQKSVINKYDEL